MSQDYAATEGGVYFVVQGDIERSKTWLEYDVGYSGDTSTFGGTINGYAYKNLYEAVANLAGSYQTERYKYLFQNKLDARIMLFYIKLTFDASQDISKTYLVDHFYCEWEEEEKL